MTRKIIHGATEKEDSRAASKQMTLKKEASSPGNSRNRISLFLSTLNYLAFLKLRRLKSL